VIQAAKAIKRRWEGVLNWFGSRLTLGFLEGAGSLAPVKAKAHGNHEESHRHGVPTGW